jgi:phosphatidyl-myo-inositol alpha-mannosyltransferase
MPGSEDETRSDLSLKVALVSPYDIGTPSGVNAHIAHLANALRERGHSPWIFAPGRRDMEVGEGITLMGRSIPVPSGGSLARVSLSPRSGRRVKKALSRQDFDIIHLHEPLVPILPMQFMRFSEVPKVGTFHTARENGSRLYDFNHRLLRRWSRMLDGRIAVSSAAAKLVSHYFPGDYEVIPNGIDLERFSTKLPVPEEIAALQPYVLFVGRFEERKGLPVLLEAFRTVQARLPDVRLVIVGQGSRRQQYEQYAEDLNVHGAHFAGYVPDELLPAYYQHAAAFCAPNTGNESFGMVLIEAMAAGAPVVASDIDGFREVVSNEEHGLLVPPLDAAALAEGLCTVLRDSSLTQSLRLRGYQRACHFSWDSVVERVVEYYERVLEREHDEVLEKPVA